MLWWPVLMRFLLISRDGSFRRNSREYLKADIYFIWGKERGRLLSSSEWISNVPWLQEFLMCLACVHTQRVIKNSLLCWLSLGSSGSSWDWNLWVLLNKEVGLSWEPKRQSDLKELNRHGRCCWWCWERHRGNRTVIGNTVVGRGDAMDALAHSWYPSTMFKINDC